MAGMQIAEMPGRNEVERCTGSLIIRRRFSVQRPGGAQHIVEVEMTEGPQAEHCDCRGYHYRGTCSHIQGVYDAGLLDQYVD